MRESILERVLDILSRMLATRPDKKNPYTRRDDGYWHYV